MGGDSGGPSFVEMYGELMLIATNTFSATPRGMVGGTFGTYFGDRRNPGPEERRSVQLLAEAAALVLGKPLPAEI